MKHGAWQRRSGWWLAVAGLCLASALARGGEDPAVAVVERLHASLIESMQRGPEAGYPGRLALLTPVVAASFDFPTIARIIVGRTWKELSPGEQAQFLQAFEQLSAATYAARFDAYDGETFRTLESSEQRDARVVKTELVKADGETVSFVYLLRETATGWKIVNVVVDGVSDLSLKRAEYPAVIRQAGFAGLLEKLAEQSARYAEPAGGD